MMSDNSLEQIHVLGKLKNKIIELIATLEKTDNPSPDQQQFCLYLKMHLSPLTFSIKFKYSKHNYPDTFYHFITGYEKFTIDGNDFEIGHTSFYPEYISILKLLKGHLTERKFINGIDDTIIIAESKIKRKGDRNTPLVIDLTSSSESEKGSPRL